MIIQWKILMLNELFFITMQNQNERKCKDESNGIEYQNKKTTSSRFASDHSIIACFCYHSALSHWFLHVCFFYYFFRESCKLCFIFSLYSVCPFDMSVRSRRKFNEWTSSVSSFFLYNHFVFIRLNWYWQSPKNITHIFTMNKIKKRRRMKETER